jgi:hypothetical protein
MSNEIAERAACRRNIARLEAGHAIALRSLDSSHWHVVNRRLLCQFPPTSAGCGAIGALPHLTMNSGDQAGLAQEALQ